MPDRALHQREEVRRRVGRDRARGAAGHEEAEGVDRVGRVGHDDHVAGRGDGLGDVGEALLGAERRHDLRVGVQRHAEAALVVGRLCAPQSRDPLGGGIAVDARLGERLDELVLDVLGRVEVGVAHAEVDDVGAGLARGRLEAVHLLEDVRRQALDAIELRVHAMRLAGERKTAGHLRYRTGADSPRHFASRSHRRLRQR